MGSERSERSEHSEQRERILVVDDEPSVVELCTIVLTAAGYQAYGAAGGQEALARLEREQFDLLLLDLFMPGLDGLTVLRRARELDPAVTAVILTGYGTIENAIEALRTGARGFVLKPFKPGELLGAVAEALAERRRDLATLLRELAERKRAEEALRESEEQYRLLVESANEAIVVAQDGMLKFYNSKAVEFSGYSLEEWKAKPFAEIIHPDDRAMAVEYYLRCLQGEETPQIYRLRIVSKDGNIKWLESNAVLIDWEGRPATLNFLSDITERRRAEEALRRSLEETARGQRMLLALGQAAQAVQRARTPADIYRTVGDEVAKLGYNTVIFAVTEDRAHLVVSHLTFQPDLLQEAERLVGLSVSTLRLRIEPGSLYDQVVMGGQTLFFEPMVNRIIELLPRLTRPLANQVARLLGTEQAVYAPLKVGGESHGMLVVTGVGLSQADLPAVAAFASQAAIALENVHLLEQVRALADYLQAAREEERAHIAREIHDEFAQTLTALKIDLSWLARHLPADQPHLADKTRVMSDLVDSAIQLARRVATELRPGLLDDLGLVAALEWQAQEFAERTGIACDLYLGDEELTLNRDRATAIFRIFQETLTNVARHAQATEVQVELRSSPAELVLVVRDNGKGITAGQLTDRHSLGLLGMRERARVWGGDVAIQGTPGQGTTVTVRVPQASAEEGHA